MNIFTPPPRDPMVQSWTLEIQRELPDNIMVSVGYVGTHGTHLMGEPFRQFSYIHTADVLKYRASINAVVPCIRARLCRCCSTSTEPPN